MQEVYSMILNTSVTTVIAVIFLWQYVTNAKKASEEDKKDKEECRKVSEALKELKDSNVACKNEIVSKLNEFIELFKKRKRIDK